MFYMLCWRVCTCVCSVVLPCAHRGRGLGFVSSFPVVCLLFVIVMLMLIQEHVLSYGLKLHAWKLKV